MEHAQRWVNLLARRRGRSRRHDWAGRTAAPLHCRAAVREHRDSAEQGYFVDGVTESLTTDLSRMSGAFVIARNTAFAYKGKPADARQIGRGLGVRYVLEGSVQRSGERMRVNVQLIEAAAAADCDLHLALVSIEESGSAEHTGYCGRRSSSRFTHR